MYRLPDAWIWCWTQKIAKISMYFAVIPEIKHISIIRSQNQHFPLIYFEAKENGIGIGASSVPNDHILALQSVWHFSPVLIRSAKGFIFYFYTILNHWINYVNQSCDSLSMSLNDGHVIPCEHGSLVGWSSRRWRDNVWRVLRAQSLI